MSFIGGISPYWEFGVHADWFEETVTTADPYYEDTEGFPILHDTTLSEFPLGVDLRFVPGGRRLGKPVFYVGASAGINLWEYDEVGDFVDETDPLGPSIYYGEFHESGEALQWGALAGVELPLDPRFHLLFESRYAWADGDLDGDLAALDEIDLGVFSATVGCAIRF